MKTEQKKLVKYALVAVLALVVLAGAVTLRQAVRGGRFDKIAYTVESYDRKLQYELVRVERERGEDPIYKVQIETELIDVTEEAWERYLGDDYNAVTYHVEEVCLQKKTFGFGYCYQRISRGNYPWEEQVRPFTEEEVDILIQDVRKSGWKDTLFRSETSVDVHETTRGYSNGTFPESGATEYQNKKIDWWWN